MRSKVVVHEGVTCGLATAPGKPGPHPNGLRTSAAVLPPTRRCRRRDSSAQAVASSPWTWARRSSASLSRPCEGVGVATRRPLSIQPQAHAVVVMHCHAAAPPPNLIGPTCVSCRVATMRPRSRSASSKRLAMPSSCTLAATRSCGTGRRSGGRACESASGACVLCYTLVRSEPRADPRAAGRGDRPNQARLAWLSASWTVSDSGGAGPAPLPSDDAPCAASPVAIWACRSFSLQGRR